MQLHNILIADSHYAPPFSVQSQHDFVIDLGGGNLTARLSEELSALQLPRGSGINLVMDQQFIRYRHFRLPQIAARKIRQILLFELEDTLLQGAESYSFRHFSRTDKKSGITEIGVFVVEKQLLDELTLLFRQFNLELKYVTSLENLISIAFQENDRHPETCIHIDIAETLEAARLFVYQNGFLADISALPRPHGIPPDSQLPAVQGLLDRINRKLDTIRLSIPDAEPIIVTGPGNNRVTMDGQWLIPLREATDNPDAENGGSGKIRLDHPSRVNLIHSNILIIQELKKYSRSLAVAAGLIFVSLALYVAAVGYRGYVDQQTLQVLEKRLDETIHRYLPKGTTTTNVLGILRERVEGLETENRENRLFEQRRYTVSRTLTELSLLKADIPSLTIDRISLNEQVIRFQGSTATINGFDQLQETLRRLYPLDSYRIISNEKTRGGGSVGFTTSIQQLKR